MPIKRYERSGELAPTWSGERSRQFRPWRDSTARRIAGAAVVLILSSAIGVEADRAGTVLQIPAALFVITAPMIALARLLPGAPFSTAMVVGFAGAIAVNVVTAEAMLVFGLWSPPAGIVVVGVVTCSLLLVPVSHREVSSDD